MDDEKKIVSAEISDEDLDQAAGGAIDLAEEEARRIALYNTRTEPLSATDLLNASNDSPLHTSTALSRK